MQVFSLAFLAYRLRPSTERCRSWFSAVVWVACGGLLLSCSTGIMVLAVLSVGLLANTEAGIYSVGWLFALVAVAAVGFWAWLIRFDLVPRIAGRLSARSWFSAVSDPGRVLIRYSVWFLQIWSGVLLVELHRLADTWSGLWQAAEAWAWWMVLGVFFFLLAVVGQERQGPSGDQRSTA